MATTDLRALKAYVGRWPAVDRRLKAVYYAVREVLERHVLGTRLQEHLWRRRAPHPAAAREAAFVEAVNHPHRPLVLAAVEHQGPVNSLLELGCGAGPNLRLLSQRYPDARLIGLDINAWAVREGQERFAALGTRNMILKVGSVERLTAHPDRSVDVVLTDAVLMYVGPDRIRHVLAELVRVARRSVILSEWQLPPTPPESAAAAGSSRTAARYYYGHWIHDYVTLLSAHVPRQRITVTRYPADAWEDDNWRTFGCVVAARC